MMFLLLNFAMPWLIHERDINIDEGDINIEIDVEFNDNCASQYKCVWAIQSFARRNVSSIRVYFEISHGKSKSDSLGGIVKGYASREAAATNIVIRNAAELYQFCNEKLTVLGSDEHKKMLNRLFFICWKKILNRINHPSHLLEFIGPYQVPVEFIR